MNHIKKQEEIIENLKYFINTHPEAKDKIDEFKQKAKDHKEEVEKRLGSLKCVLENDEERIECAKILIKYREII